MTKAELLEKIKNDVLQREDDISFEMSLNEIEEWDSLAIISTISLYDNLFGIVFTVNKIRECKTINDLINLVADRLKE